MAVGHRPHHYRSTLPGVYSVAYEWSVAFTVRIAAGINRAVRCAHCVPLVIPHGVDVVRVVRPSANPSTEPLAYARTIPIRVTPIHIRHGVMIGIRGCRSL